MLPPQAACLWVIPEALDQKVLGWKNAHEITMMRPGMTVSMKVGGNVDCMP